VPSIINIPFIYLIENKENRGLWNSR